MSEKMLSFQKFNDLEIANTIAQTLEKEGIPCKVVDDSPKFDPSFANNKIDSNVELMLSPTDFDRARVSLEAWYASQLDHMDPDYYLFSFTDEELQDLVHHPDEWNPLDLALAKKILAQHGQPVTADQEADIRTQRLETLAQPEKSSPYWVILGYASFLFPMFIDRVFSIYIGFSGFLIGFMLIWTRKNLPNGQQTYMFSESDRRHGKRILIVSCIALPIWVKLRFF